MYDLVQAVAQRALLAAGAAALLLASQPAEARPVQAMNVHYVSPYVDMVTLLPGERFPLRVTNAAGLPVEVDWKASGGTLAEGDGFSLWKAPLKPGAYRLTGRAVVDGKPITRTLSAVVTVPVAKVHGGKLNGYPIGAYPKGFSQATSMVANRGVRKAYDVPVGFIELTQANLDVPVSKHYKLRDFAGKDSFVGGRKYLFIEPKLVEKLERVVDKLEASGYAGGKVELMSAYRSPWLNAAIGNQTSLSRHTYGDAADMLVRDFNHDGRSDRKDAEILWGVVTKLDAEPGLTGGAGFYHPNAAHGFFIHTDTRGVPARW